VPPDEPAAAEAPSADPVGAVEEAAHVAAEAVEDVAEGVAEAADEATGEIPSGAASALEDRVVAMEGALVELRQQMGRLPGMAELSEAAGELAEAESEAAGAVEAPVTHVTVERSDGESPPKRPFWPRKWPRWL
jgi:hypothetical protein